MVCANGCNVHHHAHLPTFIICNTLVCLPTDVQHCTVVTCDSSQGNAPGILWPEQMAQYTCQVWNQAFGSENSPTHFMKYFYSIPLSVCHTLLDHTRCLTAQDQDGKFVEVMTRVTAYNLHLIFILYILFSSLYLIVFFNSTHSAVSDHKRNQKFKSKLRSVV